MTKNETLLLAVAGLVVLGAASRKAGATVAAVSPQPGQQQRDNGLATWLGQMSRASMAFTTVPVPADSTLMSYEPVTQTYPADFPKVIQ